jgi:hypothetical protein
MVRARARHRLFAALAMLAILSGCTRLSPAGFWTTYRPELIAGKYSDQGPWGGIRWVQWQAAAPGTFTVADAKRFAGSKGWTCGDPISYSADQIRMWQIGGKPVFPLHFGPPDRPPHNATVDRFPLSITGDSSVMQCDSGWTRVEPGLADTKKAYGYIQVEKAGTRLAVYHLWGEI